ncbi:hypothetical protein DAEQUDRAFT_762284 [Daedalea quercina L-15889]|uniref:DUF6533 domain-containing protein n=1 Tax=Daedalea quercina L-15889 TaxID=1314783 RepID=A0A165TFT3_9APHY|nr:hypothetical protein DAEQUDRAFT_762284 [Daedalea quercina L-15889]
MTTASEAAELEELLSPYLIASDRIAYLAVAGFALVVYDHFLTFSQEVKYFWTGTWTLSRVLFLTVIYAF